MRNALLILVPPATVRLRSFTRSYFQQVYWNYTLKDRSDRARAELCSQVTVDVQAVISHQI